MLPTFPEFKPLEVTDRDGILDIIKSFSPYSDFDFVSMWSWDYSNMMGVSQLNRNLVIKFSDYITGEYFYSFIGSNKLNETSSELLKHAKENNLLPYLKLVPQIVAHNLNTDSFLITSDEDNDDYLLETGKLATLEGPDLSSKRRAVSIFTRTHGDFEVVEINLNDTKVQDDIYKLFNVWSDIKLEHGSESNDHELVAIQRCVSNADALNLFATGMYNGDTLIAFWIVGLRENKCSVSHFEKADTKNFDGIFPYFKQKVAKQLIEKKGINFINLEQDLGIPGLRQSKQVYKPSQTLKKYIVHTKSE
ncbi:MAG: phosphatidylglycerol lysyltransferase domain-containing protein [Patescibacteria group bacterium]